MDFKLRVFSTFSIATLLVTIGMAGCASTQTSVKERLGTDDVPAAIGQDSRGLFGTWKLVSMVYEFQDGRSPVLLLGKNPNGYLVLAPSGRMAAVLEGDGRKPAKNDEERAALMRSLIAYTGKYRIEGDKWITKVDASWNNAWNGTEQERTYRLEGDKLFVISMWQPDLVIPGNPMAHGILEWKREK